MPLVTVILMVTVVTIQGQPQAQAQDEEGGCIEMDASNIGEGWTRLVCEGEPDRYFNPDGIECNFNSNAGIEVTGCGEGVSNSDRILVE